jgi:nitroreductase
MTDLRSTDTAVDPLFLRRWSPRALDGSALAADELRSLLDAARWAPSAYNYQPWRFLYALRGTPAFDRFLEALVPFNQGWARHASVLVYIVSEETMGSPEKPSHSHSFDAGAAWAQLGLQASIAGLVAHGMTGIDFEKARELLAVPEGWRIEAAIAIGRRADPSVLPEQLRGGEQPSGRKPIEAIAFEGGFPA